MPGEFHGQKNIEDYSSRSHKESDMTEQLKMLHFFHDNIYTHSYFSPFCM